MGWFTFSMNGNATTPQTDDAETATVLETGLSYASVPKNISLQDIVLTAAASDDHEYSVWVNGKKQSSNLYAAELSPASNSRFSIAAQNVVIPAGSQIQIRSAQKTGASAEATKITLVYQ